MKVEQIIRIPNKKTPYQRGYNAFDIRQRSMKKQIDSKKDQVTISQEAYDLYSQSKKKKITMKDDRTNYVYYIQNTSDIFGTYCKLEKPLASIEDIKNHYEIWDAPLVVKEGLFRFGGTGYIKIG
jgi:hypothetical protein